MLPPGPWKINAGPTVAYLHDSNGECILALRAVSEDGRAYFPDLGRAILALPALLAALQGFAEACGGNPPDWLQAQYDAADKALNSAGLP